MADATTSGGNSSLYARAGGLRARAHDGWGMGCDGKCQTACKPGSVPALRAGDDHSSGTSVAGRLAQPTRMAARKRARLRGACHPYLVLLPVGFTVPPPLPAARCALTAPFHPCRPPVPRGRSGLAVCFLWHCPWGRPRRALPGTVLPWSPDFPPPGLAAGERPSGRLARLEMAGPWPRVNPGLPWQ